jgi:hypothetical protein
MFDPKGWDAMRDSLMEDLLPDLATIARRHSQKLSKATDAQLYPHITKIIKLNRWEEELNPILHEYVRSNISMYGATNMSEMFAEALTMYMTNQYSGLSRIFGDLMVERYKTPLIRKITPPGPIVIGKP